jgi:hypothetical protein
MQVVAEVETVRIELRVTEGDSLDLLEGELDSRLDELEPLLFVPTKRRFLDGYVAEPSRHPEDVRLSGKLRLLTRKLLLTHLDSLVRHRDYPSGARGSELEGAEGPECAGPRSQRPAGARRAAAA